MTKCPVIKKYLHLMEQESYDQMPCYQPLLTFNGARVL